MKETERLKIELAKSDHRPTEFSEQLQRFKKFKEQMLNAGVYRENTYDVPLMHRLGAFRATDKT